MKIRISYDISLEDRWAIALQFGLDKPACYSDAKQYIHDEGMGGIEELYMCYREEIESLCANKPLHVDQKSGAASGK